MLPTNTPRAVMTAATCTSLWVSTPSITSLAALSSWSSDTGWGILGMVVCLLIATERMACQRQAKTDPLTAIEN